MSILTSLSADIGKIAGVLPYVGGPGPRLVNTIFSVEESRDSVGAALMSLELESARRRLSQRHERSTTIFRWYYF